MCLHTAASLLRRACACMQTCACSVFFLVWTVSSHSWVHALFGPRILWPMQVPEAVVEQMYASAYQAALQEQKLAGWAQRQEKSGAAGASVDGNSGSEEAPAGEAGAGSNGSSSAKPPKGWQQLKLHAGGRVDGPLITAFALASGGDSQVGWGS